MVKVSYLRYQKCCACKVSLRNKNYNRFVQRITLVTVCKCRIFFEDNNIQVGDYICYKYPENVDFEMNPKNYSTYYKVFIHYNSIDEAKPYKQIKGKSQKMLHE